MIKNSSSNNEEERTKLWNKKAAIGTSRPQWTTLKNPRIVGVSRTSGGKDRHSKVCTIRGLRDRRIRLSVPTAIQLYELQDRLGLTQPSKVVDWLIQATQSDIDKLPPLQFHHNSLEFPSNTLSLSQFPEANSSAYSVSAISESLFSTTTLHVPFMFNNNLNVESGVPFNNHQIFNSSSTSFIPTLHLPIDSPFRRYPTVVPFLSSKVLDHSNNATNNG